MNNFLSSHQAGGRWSKVLSPNKVQYNGRIYCAPGKFEFDSQLTASLAETFLQKQGPRGLSDPKLDNWQLYTGQEALTNSQKADYDQNLRDVETARRRRDREAHEARHAAARPQSDCHAHGARDHRHTLYHGGKSISLQCIVYEAIFFLQQDG